MVNGSLKEANMEWLQSNWIWFLFGGLFIWMHLSGRGCCSHGRHDSSNKHDDHSNASGGHPTVKTGDGKSEPHSNCH
jgi:hypothetical protein